MRKLLRRLGRILALALSTNALVIFPTAALAASGINLNTGVRKEFTDCSSGGSVAQTFAAPGQYMLRITDQDTFLCFAASGSTCASGGEKFPAGMAMIISLSTDQLSVSCRSASSIGDAIFTAANQ